MLSSALSSTSTKSSMKDACSRPRFSSQRTILERCGLPMSAAIAGPGRPGTERQRPSPSTYPSSAPAPSDHQAAVEVVGHQPTANRAGHGMRVAILRVVAGRQPAEVDPRRLRDAWRQTDMAVPFGVKLLGGVERGRQVGGAAKAIHQAHSLQPHLAGADRVKVEMLEVRQGRGVSVALDRGAHYYLAELAVLGKAQRVYGVEMQHLLLHQ